MGLKWGAAWGKVKQGLKLAAWVWPPAKAISAAMDAAEAMKHAKGADKLAHVEGVAASVIDLSGLSPEKATQAKAMIRTAIEAEHQMREAVVAIQHAIQEAQDAWTAVQAFIEAAK